jgi:multidrug resistance efflux pump
MHLKLKAAGLCIILCAICAARTLRITGVVQPLHSFVVQVPQIQGQGGGQVTLTRLVENGVRVNEGDLLAEFDDTKEQQALRDAAAKYEDLSHQVDQKAAEHRNNSAKRDSDLEQAMADLSKAQIEMRKGPILSDLDRQKNQIKVQDGQDHVASLQKSIHFHEEAEAAESRILELQRDRQKLAVQRAQSNIQKLSLRAPIGGMVVLQNLFRNNSLGHAQEGDQLYSGQPLLRLFDPGEMVVEASIQEPDVIALRNDTQATVHLDAYPGSTFKAVFESASPVASGGMQSPIRTFSARFRLLNTDPHLLPDLSAALDVEVPK